MVWPVSWYSNEGWITFFTYADSDIFCRSLFSTFGKVLLSCTTENSEVSPAKSLSADYISADRPLM